MNKKILILGASGFIGKNVAFFFSKKKKFKVYGTYLSRKPKLTNVKLVKANLIDRKIVKKITKNKDIVINCAAITSGAKDIVTKPYIHVSDNTVINSNVISACFDNKVKQLILLSCTLMYKSSKYKVKETDINLNDKIYEKYFGGAWMKIYMEKMSEFFSKISKMKVTIIRHSNIYGPFDKFDLKKSHVFGATITKVLQSKVGKIEVLGEGKEKRDLLYIDDLINFIDLALKKQNKNFAIYNCGYGEYISIKSLVSKIIKISGKNLRIHFNKKFSSIKTFVKLNTNLAKKDLGWQPKVKLDHGIKKTIKWYRENLL